MDLRSELEDRIRGYNTRNSYEYATVAVLIMFWQDDDLGVFEEIKQLSSVFSNLYKFVVRQFVIPSYRAEAALTRGVGDFVYEFGGEDSLIILYYGGHGDPDRNGDKQSVWAAKRSSGPTARWYLIQPILSSSNGDVLLLLDCCHAGQAVRDRSAHKFELLAAATMNLVTPGPTGPHKSFTSVLISELTALAMEPNGFLVSGIHARMVRKEAGLQQQPFLAFIAGSSFGSIRLKALTGSSQEQSSGIGQYAELEVRLSLFKKPTIGDKNQILRWMTANRPTSISSVQVERVFELAQASERIGQGVFAANEIPAQLDGSRSTLRSLTAEASSDIQSRLVALREQLTSPIPDYNLDSASILAIIASIERKGKLLCETLENCITDMHPQALDKISSSKEAKATGFANLIDLYLLLMSEAPVGNGDLSGLILFTLEGSPRDRRWRRGTFRGSPVLVEYWYYDAGSTSGSSAPIAVSSQVNKVSELLSRLKNPAFCALRSHGYTHELLSGPRFGMVYTIPSEHTDHPFHCLYDILELVPLVPLNARIRVAHTLAVSMLYFHIIGWLHKGFNSANVLLFRREPGDPGTQTRVKYGDLDFKNPRVCGFDYSRPDEAESWLTAEVSLKKNLYRHPDRWTRPVRYQMKHDIYALGVLLLEIGLWKRASDVDPHRKGFQNVAANPTKVQSAFVELAGNNLAHRAGEAYAGATKFCLTFKPPESLNESSVSTLKSLRENVIATLEEARNGMPSTEQ